MAQKRAVRTGLTTCYHVFSHLCDRHPDWEDADKEMFRKQLWKTAYSCGVEILTYSVMSNHFHVLLRIPDEIRMSDRELLERYRVLYPRPNKFQSKAIEDYERELTLGGESAERARESLLKRMGDLSKFMQLLKQRFSIWYNKTHGRYGALWSSRFKSVLLEDSVATLKVVAAYIDLNAVRAGLVQDPGDYRFCGYAEWLAGFDHAREGFKGLFKSGSGDEMLSNYRQILFGKGALPKSSDGSGCVLDPEKVRQVLETGGKVSPSERLLYRTRYFRDGCVLGSKEFVSETIPFLLATGASRRKSRRVHKIPGHESTGIASFRKLNKDH